MERKQIFLFDQSPAKPEKGYCFVLMPFREDFNALYFKVVKPIIEGEDVKMKCLRADEIYGPSAIMADIWEQIRRAEIVIADLTTKNPNVLYELGLAHALAKKVIIMSQTIEDVPFDLKHIRCLLYSDNLTGREQFEKELVNSIEALKEIETPEESRESTLPQTAFHSPFQKLGNALHNGNVHVIDEALRTILSQHGGKARALIERFSPNWVSVLRQSLLTACKTAIFGEVPNLCEDRWFLRIVYTEAIRTKLTEYRACGDNGKVRLGITAPKHIPVHRREIYDAIQHERETEHHDKEKNDENHENE